jgi:leucyl-tRNA synthetase
MGDYGIECPWNDDAIKGVSRFLDRVYSLKDKVTNDDRNDLESILHRCIKKVSNDIESMKFNTAIEELMKLVNTFYEKGVTKNEYEVLIKLLYPFAPHITEELNKEVLGKDSLVYSSWPAYDESKTVDNSFEMIVQVNGKLRDKVVVNANITKEEMESIALNSSNAKKFIDGKEVVKVVVVPNKLVNIVIK